MTSVYLCSRMSRKIEMQNHARDLRALPGVEVVSRWVFAQDDDTDETAASVRDIEDCLLATAAIIFTEPKAASHNGRLTEMGFCWGLGLDIYACGPIEGESIFFRHPHIRVFEDWPQALATLAVRLQ